MDITPVPSLSQFVQKTISPSTGFGMALRCSKVIRGGRNPLLSNLTSRPADGSGALLSVLMPTWANNALLTSRKIAIKKVDFFIGQNLFQVSGLLT
jgi:hypothetical protein